MTARIGALGRLQAWVAQLLGKSEALPATEPAEELFKLPRLLMGLASSTACQRGVQVVVDAVNSTHLTCKSREKLVEGETYELAMLLQGVGHVRLKVSVEWVLLSNYGHSAGFVVNNDPQGQAALASFVQLTRSQSRG